MNRLRLAVRIVAGAGSAMAVAFGVAHAAGRPDLIPMVVAALVALQIGFVVNDATVGGQLVSTAVAAGTFGAAAMVGTAAGGDRSVSLVLLGAFVFAGVWIRRFGRRGVGIGMMAWMGDFIGFYLGGDVGGYRWEETFIAVGTVAMLAVGLGLFWPRPARAVARTQRSFLARAKGVAAAAGDLVSVGTISSWADDDRARAAQGALHRMRRAQDRLNETALMIDSQLATPSALPEGTSAQALHQHLFDAELAMQTVARMAEQLMTSPIRDTARGRITEALDAVRSDDVDEAARLARALVADLASWEPVTTGRPSHAHAAIYRLAGALVAWSEALRAWMAVETEAPRDASDLPFRPTVDLVAGYLPGSAAVAPTAALQARRGLAGRLLPSTRLAVQMTVAVSAAIVVGDAISGRRFYWAALAAFLAFFGANTTGEQVTKAFNRVAGTVIGLISGILLAHLVGHRVHVALAVSLVALFLGLYFMRVSYALFVIGLVTMMGQVYVQFGEFTNGLLFLRLGETAVGAVIAMAAAVLIFPVRTEGAVTVALSDAVRRLGSMLADAGGDWKHDEDGEAVAQLRHDARMLDLAFQTLSVTARPMSRTLLGAGSDRITAQLARVSALRHYAANLAHFTEMAGRMDPATAAALNEIVGRMRGSVDFVEGGVTGRSSVGSYRRVAADLDRLDDELQQRSAVAGVVPSNDVRMVLHFLGLIDDTLADLAASRGLAVPGEEFVALAGDRREEVMTTEGARALVGASA
jgi:hypothetical protein